MQDRKNPQLPIDYPIHSSGKYWPNSHALRDELSIPLTLTLSPMHHVSQRASFPPARINSFRCHSCKAFINCYCSLRSADEYDCSICGCTNRVPIPFGDSDQAELQHPAYTFTTTNPAHKIKTDIQPLPTYIFTFDLSMSNIASNRKFIKLAISAVSNFLAQVKEGAMSPCKIFILTFDDYLYEYGVENGNVCKFSNIHLQELMSREGMELPAAESQVEEILKDISDEVERRQQRNIKHCSEALMKMIKIVLQALPKCSGKLLIVSPLLTPTSSFSIPIEQQPEQFHSNLTLNRDKCLDESLLKDVMPHTQISLYFFVYNSHFVNLLPIYAITKTTNGELRHYLEQSHLQFYYQFMQVLLGGGGEGREVVMKVRSTGGVKLVGIFGQYRQYRDHKDQVELLTCPQERTYTFQFTIQGKLHQPTITLQFSILSTSPTGARNFTVITHRQRISPTPSKILASLSYIIINQSYLHAVIHHIDLDVRVRNLQVTLQERCRKHVRSVRKYGCDGEGEGEGVGRVRPYMMFTFFLMRHYVLNTAYSHNSIYDKSIEIRSRILCGDESSMHIIWPAVYSINRFGWQISEMRYSELKIAQESIVINQGTSCYLYVIDEQTRESLLSKMQAQKNDSVVQILEREREYGEKLSKTIELLEEIRENKLAGFVQVLLMESLNGVCLFDEKGALGYESFVTNITKSVRNEQ